MNTVNLDITAPNDSVYEEDDVELVVFQTTTGGIGIMSGYIPTVAALEVGRIRVKFKDGTEYIVVSGDFVGIRQHKMSVVIQTTGTTSEIDAGRARLARQRAQSHLDEEDNSDINRARRALARAENRLCVVELR